MKLLTALERGLTLANFPRKLRAWQPGKLCCGFQQSQIICRIHLHHRYAQKVFGDPKLFALGFR
jgi:hypothetical protein